MCEYVRVPAHTGACAYVCECTGVCILFSGCNVQ